MNLAKALKKKSRLVQKITRLQQEIQTENSFRADDVVKISVEELMIELNTKIEELIKLKMTIFIASAPMREHILRLSELKSKIIFLQGINTREGNVSDYGENVVEYIAIYDKLYKKEEINKCENLIDELQEQLDVFNHSTEIEIDVKG